MRSNEFREILRDAAVAHAILPLVHKYDLNQEAIREALMELDVPRAATVASIAGFSR